MKRSKELTQIGKLELVEEESKESPFSLSNKNHEEEPLSPRSLIKVKQLTGRMSTVRFKKTPN